MTQLIGYFGQISGDPITNKRMLAEPQGVLDTLENLSRAQGIYRFYAHGCKVDQ